MVHKCCHKVAEPQPIKQQKPLTQITLPMQLAHQQAALAQQPSAVPLPSQPAQLQPVLTPPTPVPPALPTPANALAAPELTPPQPVPQAQRMPTPENGLPAPAGVLAAPELAPPLPCPQPMATPVPAALPALPAPAGALAAPEQLTPPQPVAQPLPTPANALAAGLATPIGQTPPPMPGPEPGPVLATHSLAGMQPVQEPDAAMPGADSPAEVVVESPQGATEHDVPEIRPESPAQFRTPERPQLLHSLQMTPEPQAQPTPRPVADDKKACLICEDDLDKKTCEALSCGHATWLHHHFTLSFLPSGLGFEMNRIVFLLSATPAHKLVVFSKLVAGARGCSASIMVAQMGRLSSYTHNICLCTMC